MQRANRRRVGLAFVITGLSCLTIQAQQSKDPAIEFVQIPAGTFRMGCSPGDTQCFGSESPPHQVTLSAFAMGKYEVTQAQYQVIMGTNPSRNRGDSFPVDSVSWSDAQEFLNRLNAKKDGYLYRLPTEAEWEYAARAGTTGATAGPLDAVGWYADNSQGRTHPVGQKRANAWGLSDMLGNVYEWVQDKAGEYVSAAQTDPKGSASDTTARVVRGGGKGSPVRWARVSARINYASTTRGDDIGFRIVREVARPASSNAGARNAVPVSTAKEAALEFVRISPGTFMMGCTIGDLLCTSIERPAHQVTITKAFEMGKYEVTQGQYQSVMGTNPSNFKGEVNLPVEQVSWEDAQEFLNRMNAKRDGHRYRLPTEAEWEYAARAGSAAVSQQRIDDVAWFDVNSGNKTHPVGQKQPNAWGIYDMLGNVREWVQDAAALYSPDAQTDPRGPASGNMTVRMVRGGSWADGVRNARPSFRYDLGSRDRYFNGGFRIVRETAP